MPRGHLLTPSCRGSPGTSRESSNVSSQKIQGSHHTRVLHGRKSAISTLTPPWVRQARVRPPLCTPRRDRPWHPWLRLRSPSREHPRQPLGPTSAFPESAHGVCRVNELCKQDPLPWLHWQTRRGPWSVLWGGGLLAGAPASCCPAWGAACHRTSRQSRWGGSEPPCWLPSVSSPYRPLTVVVPISQTRQPRHRE